MEHAFTRFKLRRGVATWQVALAVALLALGFLIAAQVRAEAPELQYSSQARDPLVNTVRDLQGQHQALTNQIQGLRQQITALQKGGQGNASEIDALNKELEAAQLAGGLTGLQGKGGYLLLTDGAPPVGSDANPADYRVTGSDVRILTAALWRCGAEAIAINEERLVTSTAILDIGGSIVVNSAYVTSPYQISVIAGGDIWTCFSKADTVRAWMTTRYGPYRLVLKYEPSDTVVLPAYAGNAGLERSQVVSSPSASGAP